MGMAEVSLACFKELFKGERKALCASGVGGSVCRWLLLSTEAPADSNASPNSLKLRRLRMFSRTKKMQIKH